jgi:SAM-dependent methyltransferase
MMQDYPTDKTYVSLVIPLLAPAFIDTAVRAQGVSAPRATGAARFHYVDLGCGYAATVLCLAAAYPEATFVGIDANPAHIETAREFAAEAGLSNAEFITARFGDLSLRAIAPAQYVVSHGVYTWIGAEAQAALIGDIARLRAPGGVVSIGASSFAGWARDLPLRRVVTSHATSSDNAAPEERLERGLQALTAARAAGARGALGHGDAEEMERMSRQYAHLADHDILSATWAPVWTADLAAALSPHGLAYAGLQVPGAWRPDFTYSAVKRAALAEAPTEEARLTLQDCFLDYKYICHLFAEPGAMTGSAPSRGDERLALTRPVADVVYQTKTSAGRLDFDNDLTRPIVQRLGQGPATITELAEAVRPSSEAALLLSVDALYASRQVVPVDLPHPAEKTAALNAVFENAGATQSACASPLGMPMYRDLVVGKTPGP